MFRMIFQHSLQQQNKLAGFRLPAGREEEYEAKKWEQVFHFFVF
jgi:hypothetical protein